MLAGGAGLAMRRSGSTPSTTQTELTQALHVDPELGTAPRTTAPIMMAENVDFVLEQLKGMTAADTRALSA